VNYGGIKFTSIEASLRFENEVLCAYI